jgi:anti-anti-sigma factor
MRWTSGQLRTQCRDRGVTGDIDVFTLARLRECLFELADSGPTLIVDLNRITFIDSAGLGADVPGDVPGRSRLVRRSRAAARTVEARCG